MISRFFFPATARTIAVLLALVTLATLRADPPAPIRSLTIAPASTRVLLNTTRLTVEPLVRADASELKAAYHVEVTPAFFLSEAGQFSLSLPDADLARLAAGQVVSFTGSSLSSSGNTSVVKGSATPDACNKDAGSIRVHIASSKGKLVFNTTYRLRR